MKIFIISLTLFFVVGCSGLSGPQDETRFTTSVKISEFNSLTNKYEYKSTHGAIVKFKNIEQYKIEAPRYGRGVLYIMVPKDNIDKYILAIDKYLEWNKKAIESQDMLEKEIVRYNSGGGFNNVIKFYSGNTSNHYMVIDSCQPGIFSICVNMANFDEYNSLRLKKELIEFKKGNLKLVDIESKYN